MMWSSSKISFPRPESRRYVRVSNGESYKNKTKLVATNTEKEGKEQNIYMHTHPRRKVIRKLRVSE